MKVELINGQIVITLPANTSNPPISSSGKTRLVASASEKTSVVVNGKILKVGVNAYIPAN